MGGRGGNRGGGGGGGAESPQTIVLENGVELRRPSFSDGSGEFQAYGIWKDGSYAGKINFGVIGQTGQIQDVELGAAARGQNMMKTVYPRIESIMKKQGATRVVLTTVTDAVAAKVWQPLGFTRAGGTDAAKKWEKKLQ
jgi:hypothetical protein